MALTGVHIACAYAGGFGRNGIHVRAMSAPVWSQTMATAGTTQAAPLGTADGDPIFEINPAVDIWLAIGPNPDAVNGPRSFVFKVSDGSIGGAYRFGKPGDKVAWVAA